MEINEHIFKDAYSDPDTSMVGFAMTPWHALGVAAASRYLDGLGVEGKRVAVIQPHSASGVSVTKDSFQDPRFHVVELPPMVGVSNYLRAAFARIHFFSKQGHGTSTGNPLFVACASFPGSFIRDLSIECKRPVHFLLLDEGIGSYLNSSKDWVRQSSSDLGLSSLLKFVRIGLGGIDASYFEKKKQALKDEDRFTRFMLLDEQLNIDPAIAICYRSVLDSLESQSYDNGNLYENAVVINTQPLREDGLIRDGIYERLVIKIDEALKLAGYKTVIKPHPREMLSGQYVNSGCVVDATHGVAQEYIFSQLSQKPLCILGFNSSSLHTAQALFDIPAISFLNLVPESMLTSKGLNSKERYYAAFSKAVHFPATLTELVDMVNAIQSSHSCGQ